LIFNFTGFNFNSFLTKIMKISKLQLLSEGLNGLGSDCPVFMKNDLGSLAGSKKPEAQKWNLKGSAYFTKKNPKYPHLALKIYFFITQEFFFSSTSKSPQKAQDPNLEPGNPTNKENPEQIIK
jgi:hypothetical protein